MKNSNYQGVKNLIELIIEINHKKNFSNSTKSKNAALGEISSNSKKIIAETNSTKGKEATTEELPSNDKKLATERDSTQAKKDTTEELPSNDKELPNERDSTIAKKDTTEELPSNDKKLANETHSTEVKLASSEADQTTNKKVTTEASKRKVFVFKGYGNYGAAFLSYQLGLVCHKKFGSPLYIVEHKKRLNQMKQRRHPIFDYPIEFPTVTIGEMKKIMHPNDLFICNSAFSTKWFGLNLPMKSLMYIQGMNTYPVLDIYFDHHVSVSHFVQEHIEQIFNKKTTVISPFINHELFQNKTKWKDRSNSILILGYKGYAEPILNHLKAYYYKKFPESSIEFKLVNGGKQKELAALYNQHKYFLTLNPSEGFGLPPLEAMACGCAVIGFDSMGGRDYFEHEKNSYIVNYGDFESLANYIRVIELHPNIGQDLAKSGVQTAKNFTYNRYEAQWTNYLLEHVYND